MIAVVLAVVVATLPIQYRIERHGGGLGVSVDESVIIFKTIGERGTARWIAEREKVDQNWCGEKRLDGKYINTTERLHDWADSKTCEALDYTVLGFEDLKKEPSAQSALIVTDSVQTTLIFEAEKIGARKPSLSEFLGPLASWWEDLDRREGCWTAQPPMVDGKKVTSRLLKQVAQ